MATKIWGAGSNAGAAGDWNNPSNWDNDTLPVDYDDILFDGNFSNADLYTGPTNNVIIGNITVSSNYAGYLSISSQTTSGIILQGNLNNNTISTHYLPLNFSGCTGFTGRWVAHCFPDGTGTFSDQLFNMISIIMDQNNTINFSNFGYTQPSPINITSSNPPAGYFNTFSAFNFNADLMGASNNASVAISANVMNLSGAFNTASGTILQTETLNIDASNPVSFNSFITFNYMPGGFGFIPDFIMTVTTLPGSSGTLNINVDSDESYVSFFDSFRVNSGGGPIGGQAVPKYILNFSAITLNYIQRGRFVLKLAEGKIAKDSNNYPIDTQNLVRFESSNFFKLTATENSVVCGDFLHQNFIGGSSSPTTVVCDFFDNSSICGNGLITANLYDNSKAINNSMVYIGPDAVHVTYENTGFVFSGQYNNRQSNKASS
jgi:hypothetical protein